MTRATAPQAATLRSLPRQIASSIEQVLEPAVITLFAQQEQVHGIAALLARLAEAVSPDGRARLDAAITAANHHLEAIAGQFGFLGRVADTLDRNARQLRSLTLQQKQNMVMASMVATNAKVVSDNLENRADSLSGFASRVKTIISEAQQTSDHVARELGRADLELKQVSKGIGVMSDAANRLERDRNALPRLLSGLDSLPDIHRAVSRSRAACEALDEALQQAVLQLQCGDAVRQRLDHVAAMLDHAAMADPASEAALVRLAHAQCAAALATLTEALHDAAPQLDRIETATKAAGSEIRTLATNGETQVFQGLAQLARRMRAGLEDLDTQRKAISPAMESLSQAYADAAETTRAMADLETRMHLLGVNAMLVSSKIGTDGAAMTQVAKHLRDCTGAIGAGSADIVRAAQLQELNAVLFSAPTAKASDPVTRAGLDAMQAECETIMGALAQSRDAAVSGQRGGIGDIRHALARFAAQTQAAASGLPPVRGEVAGLSDRTRDALDEIRRSYTMEAERSLHDQMFGAPPAVAPQPDMADIEDVFF